MRVLVVYYSRSGVTRRAAGGIAAEFRRAGCEVVVEELRERVDRSGLLGWLRAGRDAWLGRSSELEPLRAEPASFDVVVLGTPVWAGRPTPAVRSFLARRAGELGRVAFFATHGGGGADRTLRMLEGLAGRAPAAVLSLRDRAVRKEEEEGYRGEVRRFVGGLVGEGD